MLPDSTNPRVMADNIRRLQIEVENAVELPSVTGSDEGKVLTVNSSGKWAASDLPPYPIGNLDYSENEQNTGIKWIDGKSIYQKTFSGDVGTLESATDLDLGLTVDRLINVEGNVYYANNITSFPVNTYRSSSNVTNTHVSSSSALLLYVGPSYSGGKYLITVFYTKPEPAPSNETRSTKKKTTTKGEN